MRRSDALRRIGALLVAGTLALGLTGCGGTSPTGGSGNAASYGTGDTEAAGLASQGSDASEVASATQSTLKDLGGSLSLDDIAARPTIQDGTTITDEEESQYEEESRAFETLPADSLLINDAESFYYEEELTGNEAAIYQTLKAVAQDPENAGKPAAVTSTMNPKDPKFKTVIGTAWFALTYDHPEFFWIYPSSMETGPSYYYNEKGSGTNSSGDKVWVVYFELSEPYENYEEEMGKFNDATEDFLEDIDTSKSDQEVARQIHDKLIDLVTYDTDAASSESDDLAHTAYGALVEDSSGNANHAVCDGYALAYEYLLQQCGINASVVVGVGGDDESSGSHAWNAVELDGDWYETDATWDDFGALEEAAEDQRSSNQTAKYVYEALSDDDYKAEVEHYLYNVTTKTMSDFEPTDEYVYETKDGRYALCLVGSSFHTKANDVDEYNDYDKALMELAPDAEGTAFANE